MMCAKTASGLEAALGTGTSIDRPRPAHIALLRRYRIITCRRMRRFDVGESRNHSMLMIEDRESTDMDEGEPPTSGAATRTDNFVLSHADFKRF
jgi:hypothetical protein